MDSKSRIYGILSAYRLFYVGCSRARKNLTVLVNKNKIKTDVNTLIEKFKGAGFEVIDTIVNNAGRGLFGQFKSLDIEEHMNMIELNISSLVQLNYYFISDLLKLSREYILNVASIAALYPLPNYSVYGATKAFVLSYTEALRQELKNSSIIVSCLFSGDTNTDFFKNTGNVSKKKPMTSPRFVAGVAVDSLFKNKAVIYPGGIKLLSKVK